MIEFNYGNQKVLSLRNSKRSRRELFAESAEQVKSAIFSTV